MESKINVDKLLGKLQQQIGAQSVRIAVLELEIERLNAAMPTTPVKKQTEQTESEVQNG